ncbi:UDP-N-acetylmuramoyl-L-alanine--D-glutamate ligase [Helicobacter sp. MIT 00-7814]|uniref:UDP-N-acetylmuramoyl-L-alanine--D-glutamate ligase n=1 Tax=unclassified Helicobacter TaxID=2593540 RepID=UPI000E1EBB60|nr:MULTISPECIES: UDP-N-acetylmuramoyl-L-alanine--D-glutamate ligase [unclassified Helicobacter]RDU54638.1 UDP-N-acetylmuramoyl-L-alanine--D-glutamate ligase [Helicobacter sp. MIT 00-7814]RDU54697.1 UDP-N-acetylmuramoyl-L-alanine--D-glutamate ligase [Helicobacter sp. MIT 99-10781]
MITILGLGVTTKPIVAFLNALGKKLRIYDAKFTHAQSDTFGNELLPMPEDSCSQDSTPQSTRESIASEIFHKILNLPNLQELDSFVLTSPGIAPQNPLILQAQSNRALLSEYDFFYALLMRENKFSQAQMPLSAWISGTNGKTTTTQMTTALLSHLGAQSGGNIGTPLCVLYENKAPIWILETSSFALHYTHIAVPKVYALLPLSEDHITWHGSFEDYISDKLSPLARMDSQSFAILPKELRAHKLCKNYQGKAHYYADSKDLARAFGVEIESLRFSEPFLLDSLIAFGVARLLCDSGEIEVLNRFKIGAHRIEEFRDSQNRLWVDDSKGTNVDATIQALLRYQDSQILLILGGDDKGADLTPLFATMQKIESKHEDSNSAKAIQLNIESQNTNQRDRILQSQQQKNAEYVRETQWSGGEAGFIPAETIPINGIARIKIFAIGSNAQKICELARVYNLNAQNCENLKTAIDTIKPLHSADSVALLSPAAASLDQFSSYKERGELFKRYALENN